MNPIKRPDKLLTRLIYEYHNRPNIIVGVDFDDTLRDYQSHKMIEPVVDIVKECKALGFIICLYTCREDRMLKEALDYCDKWEIPYDYINESPALTNTRKPFFNILLDDRAGLNESLELLKNFLNYIKTQTK